VSGPLADLLNEPPVIAAAEGYVRILIRVPEAYLILRPFETTRPGLLVLDADARRVASFPLRGLGGTPSAKEIVKALDAARTQEPTERLLLKMPADEADAFAKTITTWKGVHRAESLPGGYVEVRMRPGAVAPARALAAGKAKKIQVACVDPVRVDVQAARKDVEVAGALAALSGVRFRAKGAASAGTIWVSRWLLHPDALAAVGLTPDVVSQRYTFTDLPRGGGAVRHLRLPFAVHGVLAVVPDVFHDAIDVVGRKGLFDGADLKQRFEKAGLTPKKD